MAKILSIVFLGLSLLVIIISILTHIGDSMYIDKHLLLPASIIFGSSLIAVAVVTSISGKRNT